VSAATARVVGGWADALITVNQSTDVLRSVIEAFREGGGEGKPVSVQVHLSWADDDEKALAIAHDQWRTNVFDSALAWNLELPSQFDAAAAFVSPDDVRRAVVVSSDPRRHAAALADIVALDVDAVYLHHVGQEQDRFIDVFGEHVIPELAS
jgi:alkanesulfonate monooxygenase SsuD/methylene tetrahydromethanopterin reductase-like flavin-dependent oxidoreductase (luciferase family)